MGTRVVTTVRCLTALLLLAAVGVAASGCDVTEQPVAEVCAASDLIDQCPAGSNPVLGAAASAACGGGASLSAVDQSGSVTGQCQSAGECTILCQYETPCSCGVVTLSKDKIVCAECPAQSCGDGRCEGTERPGCEPGAEGCFPCAEDCGQATCGDGDCTGTENPDTCPQDCANACVPNQAICVGTLLQVCAADGSTYAEVDCAEAGMACVQGQCVAAGSVCQPGAKRCEGHVLVTCNPAGTAESSVDCAASDMTCGVQGCVATDVCGNGLCEQGEDASCPQDCAATCGNDVCENGEPSACPQDCEDCGDGVCGSGELDSCPQDCGVCIPSERLCLGNIMRVCNANGTQFDDIDCGVFDQLCGAGSCVQPQQCGNGVCEIGESATCEADCAEPCGNGVCTGGETFDTCALDCGPICGDGACQGHETGVSCVADCLASCGDGTCSGLETRDNCQQDCGFCGNGVCEDGYESPSLYPASHLDSCPADCVTTGCEQDSDCNDGISCTVGVCVGGVCGYQPDDVLCGGKDKCIKFSGCCPDADGDGFADAACGGSDCDDSDGTTFPGAIEVCGGGDKNCNGTHRPALSAPKQVTSTVSYKTHLRIAQTPNGYVAAWNGVPVSKERLEYGVVGSMGSLVGGVSMVDGVELADGEVPHVAYSPQSGRFGFAFQSAEGHGEFRFGDVATGVVDEEGLELPGSICITNSQHVFYPFQVTGLTWVDGSFVVGNTGPCGQAGNAPRSWANVSEAGGVTMPWGSPRWTEQLIAAGNRAVGLGRYSTHRTALISVAPSVPGENVDVTVTPDSGQGQCVLGYDGEQLAHACYYNGEVHYNRLATNGVATVKTSVTELPIVPKAIAAAPEGLHNGDSGKVGVIGMDAGTSGANLYLFVVEQAEGELVLEPGIVAGGSNIQDPAVFFDGTHFVAFWLADKGDTQQVFQQTISCE